jgi:hypothetical protein
MLDPYPERYKPQCLKDKWRACKATRAGLRQTEKGTAAAELLGDATPIALIENKR